MRIREHTRACVSDDFELVVPSKVTSAHILIVPDHCDAGAQRQYLYYCTSKSSKLGTVHARLDPRLVEVRHGIRVGEVYDDAVWVHVVLHQLTHHLQIRRLAISELCLRRVASAFVILYQ